MENLYSVIVGNMGLVSSPECSLEASSDFDAYVDASKSNFGRAAGEPVTLLYKNGEIWKEYIPAEVL